MPGTAQAALAREALLAFGRRGFADVAVADLARAAGVTTGALYHHFGSKRGLYDLVRREAQRRALDRMEGATAAGAAVSDVLVVGFDYATGAGLQRLLGEEPGADDPVATLVARRLGATRARLLVAAWRSALLGVAEGLAPADLRAALAALRMVPLVTDEISDV